MDKIMVSPKKEQNYYILLLKAWMSLEVICCHFLAHDSCCAKVFIAYTMQAVPVFFFISFFYFAPKLEHVTDMSVLKARIKRLLLPQIGWAIIYFSVYSLIPIVISTEKTIPLSSLC